MCNMYGDLTTSMFNTAFCKPLKKSRKDYMHDRPECVPTDRRDKHAGGRLNTHNFLSSFIVTAHAEDEVAT